MPPSPISASSNFFRMLVACVSEPPPSNPPSPSTIAARSRSASGASQVSGGSTGWASDSGFELGHPSRFRYRADSQANLASGADEDEFTSGFSSASSTSRTSTSLHSPVANQASPTSATNRALLSRSTRPAWLNASWGLSGANSVLVQSQRDAATELQQERLDRCAVHYARTAASKKVTDDMLQTVEQALSKAYGADVPPHLAQVVAGMKRDAQQCTLAAEWLAPFGAAPLADAPSQRAINATDLAYAKQSAQRATDAAIACSQRLFALAEMTDAASPIDTLPQPQPAADHHIDIRKINASLAVIGSDEFQHKLTAGITLEQRLQRGLQQAGAAFEHAAGEAVEWLLPTLKTEQPEVYARHITGLLPKARNTAAIGWVAQPRLQETERCLGRSLLYMPQPTDASSLAEHTTFTQRVRSLRDQSNTLYQQISAAAKLTTRLAAHDASNWRNAAQAERDVATATAQQHHAKEALPQLEALLAEAKALPYATSGSVNLTE